MHTNTHTVKSPTGRYALAYAPTSTTDIIIMIIIITIIITTVMFMVLLSWQSHC